MKILILEDNTIDSDLARISLKKSFEACKCFMAPTIEKAKELLKNESGFDIALLDMNLPDGNGLDLLVEIRQKQKELPVVMLTGNGDEEVAVSALQSGANDYVVKREGYIDRLPHIVDLAIKNFHENRQLRSEVIDVLYIEHHPMDIDLTIRHFNRYAPFVKIHPVLTAEEGVEKLNNQPGKKGIRVILMDYNLPGTNALELIKTIRQEMMIQIPIILVTGQGSEEIAVQALKLGANEYLTKNARYLFRLPSLIMSSYRHHELKLKQEQLIENEAKYRLLAENSGDVIFVLDLDLNYTYISPAVKSLRGYEPEEVLGKNLSEVLTPKSYKKALNLLNRKLGSIRSDNAAEKHELMELELIRKDRSTVWAEVKVSVLNDDNGKPVGLLGVTRDITLRKKALTELRKLSRAVEQSPSVVTITDTLGNIEYVNPRFTQLTGYSFEEVIGKKPNILKSGYTSREEYEELWETIRAGKEWRGEFHNKRKDGSLYWELASISPIISNEGEITHFVAVKEDITERKRVFAELNEAKNKAEESDRLKSAFLASMSHEIRTPLNAIVGFSNLIAESSTDTRMKEFSSIIVKQNNLLLKLINDIIDFAQMESGTLSVVRNNFDLNVLIDDLLLIFYSQVPEGVELIPKKSPEPMVLHSDENRLKQVFSNLIGNAIKFTPGGSITFGFLTNGGDRVTCFVKDTGIGIPEEKKEFVFERFTKIDSFSQGTGLGLPISKNIVSLLGGKIWLESEPGEGTCFYFTIPVSGEKTAASTEPEVDNTEKPASGGPAMVQKEFTLLVAEDDLSNFLLVKEMVREGNVKLIHARNGEQAVEEVRSNGRIDLVLMDIKMPGMDGYEATREIKKIRPGLKVIALTAYAQAEDKKKAREAGCDDYLTKPLEANRFNGMIKKYIG